jgi:hypothetical protein
MAAKRRAWVNYCAWLMGGMLLGAIAGAALAPNTFMLILGGLAGLLIGGLGGGLVAACKPNAPRWLMGCAWIAAGTVFGAIGGALIGSALLRLSTHGHAPDVSGMGGLLGNAVHAFFGSILGALVGASTGGLVLSELLKRRAERNGS